VDDNESGRVRALKGQCQWPRDEDVKKSLVAADEIRPLHSKPSAAGINE